MRVAACRYPCGGVIESNNRRVSVDELPLLLDLHAVRAPHHRAAAPVLPPARAKRHGLRICDEPHRMTWL